MAYQLDKIQDIDISYENLTVKNKDDFKTI